ncbi:MAG TPA: glycosyltransferase family 4 protein [Candidatus Acidoferrales bacterium]|nr:glycosyltransferase family 4 protein [Candidatus Acidoferrales bacterium]
MRLLVVGHPLTIAWNQRKYVEMKRVEPGLRLRVVVPKQIHDTFSTYRWEAHPELGPGEVNPLASAFSRSHMTLILNPVGLGKVLHDFWPDVIHIEEEPHAMMAVWTIGLRVAICPQAAVTLFTWDNLHRRHRFPLGALKNKLRCYSLRRTAAVVCGNCDAERLLRKNDGYRGVTTVLPQFGLDPGDHTPGCEPALKARLGLGEAIVVGYVGRLVPEKGLELLLEALASLAEIPWKLILVGEGSLRARIHDHWMPRLPGRIVHVPAVPHAQVPGYLRCLDIFVLASYKTPRWKEQFGLTLAQAMMLGLPSIASSSGAIPEVAGPGALIFEEGNLESLRQALRTMLRAEPWRRELGAKAREFALRHYTLQEIAASYLRVFEKASAVCTATPRASTPDRAMGPCREEGAARAEKV